MSNNSGDVNKVVAVPKLRSLLAKLRQAQTAWEMDAAVAVRSDVAKVPYYEGMVDGCQHAVNALAELIEKEAAAPADAGGVI